MKIGEKAAGEISDRSAHLVYEGEWEGRRVVWRLRWQGSSQKIVAREMVSPWVKVTCQRSPTFHRNGSVPVSCPTQHFAGRSSGERLWHILDGGYRGAATAETVSQRCGPKADVSGCFPKCIAEECFPSHRKEYNLWFLWNDVLTSFLWWRIWRVCVLYFTGWHFLVIKSQTPIIPGKNSNNLST